MISDGELKKQYENKVQIYVGKGTSPSCRVKRRHVKYRTCCIYPFFRSLIQTREPRLQHCGEKQRYWFERRTTKTSIFIRFPGQNVVCIDAKENRCLWRRTGDVALN